MPPQQVDIPGVGRVEFPDTMSADDVTAAAKRLHDQANPPKRTWVDTAVDALPIVGGAVGGALGSELGPGAIVTAGIGGAAGERLKEYANALRGKADLPSTTDALKAMGTQGAVQAGAEVGGRLISAGLKAAAPRLYQAVLKPTAAMRAEYPNLAQTAIDNAVPVSAGGAAKTEGLIQSSKATADKLVADAAAAPNAATIDPRQAVAGITQAVQDVKGLPVARPQMQAIGDYARAYLAEHPGVQTLPEAQDAVRATDRFFNSAYRATMDRGNPVTAGSTAAALGINNETRNLLRQAVPGLQAQNAETQGLVGLKDAVERRAGQLANNSPIGMQHFINAGIGGLVGAREGQGKGLGAFLAAEALTNPAVASQVAIAAGRAGGVPAGAIRTALLAKFGVPDLIGDER